MKVLDRPIEFISRIGNAFTPKTEAERRAGMIGAVVALVALVALYYYLV